MRWNRFVRIAVETESGNNLRGNAAETETKTEIETKTETFVKELQDQKCRMQAADGTEEYEREFQLFFILGNRESWIR